MWNTLQMLGTARLLPHQQRSLLKALAACVLIAGMLDISDALIFYGIRGTPPRLLLQAIASGLLGRSAFQGGVPAALLGLGVHYFITFVWATLFLVSSLKFPILRRYAVVTGILYGMLIYALMNYVVLPLSRAAGHSAFRLSVLLNGVLALIFCMGLPIAIISKVLLPDEG